MNETILISEKEVFWEAISDLESKGHGYSSLCRKFSPEQLGSFVDHKAKNLFTNKIVDDIVIESFDTVSKVARTIFDNSGTVSEEYIKLLNRVIDQTDLSNKHIVDFLRISLPLLGKNFSANKNLYNHIRELIEPSTERELDTTEYNKSEYQENSYFFPDEEKGYNHENSNFEDLPDILKKYNILKQDSTKFKSSGIFAIISTNSASIDFIPYNNDHKVLKKQFHAILMGYFGLSNFLHAIDNGEINMKDDDQFTLTTNWRQAVFLAKLGFNITIKDKGEEKIIPGNDFDVGNYPGELFKISATVASLREAISKFDQEKMIQAAERFFPKPVNL